MVAKNYVLSILFIQKQTTELNGIVFLVQQSNQIEHHHGVNFASVPKTRGALLTYLVKVHGSNRFLYTFFLSGLTEFDV